VVPDSVVDVVVAASAVVVAAVVVESAVSAYPYMLPCPMESQSHMMHSTSLNVTWNHSILVIELMMCQEENQEMMLNESYIGPIMSVLMEGLFCGLELGCVVVGVVGVVEQIVGVLTLLPF
jgi:hypothetical protein